MKQFLFAALAVVTLSAGAACEDKFPYDVPRLKGDYSYLCRIGYAVIHDNNKKIPFVAYEHLQPAKIGNGNVQRKNAFREDKDVPSYGRSKPKDYSKDGKTYDRGHLANAQNASDAEAMNDTFLLSNIVPQVGAFNRGQWKSLETNIAKKVRRGRELFVITGTVAYPPYTSIGNGVVVPTAMFKIVIDKSTNEAIAYLMGNQVSNKSYKSHTLSINDLTKLLGEDLVPSADSKLKNEVSSSLR